MRNFVQSRILPLVLGSTAIILASTVPVHALTYNWNVNLSQNGYSAVGNITTDTNTPNVSLSASDITSWSYTLTNLSNGITDTLNSTNSSEGYSALLQVNSTGSSLILVQNSAFSAISPVSTVNGNTSNLYFGYPFSTGAIPNLFIKVNNGGTTPGSYSDSSNIYTTNVFATAAVPFDIPYGATIPAIGTVLALGVMRKARKFTSNNRLITTSEKVN